MSVLLSKFEYFIEEKLGLLIGVWISMPKLLPRVQILDAKTTKKDCYVGTLEAFHLWTLGIAMKAEGPNFCSLSIRLLNFL